MTMATTRSSRRRPGNQRYGPGLYQSYSSSTSDLVIRVQILAGGHGNDVIDASDSLGLADIAGGSGSDDITGSANDDVIWGDGYNGVIRVTTGQCFPQVST